MKGQLTVARYRGIDLTLFAAKLCVFEGIIVTAATRWFPQQPYTVSVVPAVAAIVMMRWGGWAAIHAVLGGAVFCAFSRAGLKQYLVYAVGNLFCLGALGIRKAFGEEAIRTDSLKTLLFGLVTVMLMELGRAVMALSTGAAFTAALGFFTTDVVTVLFTLVILWIVRRLDGVFEDQHHYLLRVQEEQREERGG